MHTQTLQNRQPDALRGIGIIALAALAVLAGSAFFTRMQPQWGTLSSLLFIAYGCAIAWFLLNWYVMRFIYTSNDDCLRVCRAYGKRERFMTDVWFNQVLGYGSPEEVKARFPSARAQRATRQQSPLEPFALAYRDGDKQALLIIQPDEEMKAHILGRLKKK